MGIPTYRNERNTDLDHHQYENVVQPPTKQRRPTITKQTTIPERDVERGRAEIDSAKQDYPQDPTQPVYYNYPLDKQPTIVPSLPPTLPSSMQQRAAITPGAPREFTRTPMVEPMTRMLPPRPHMDDSPGMPPDRRQFGGSAPTRRKLPEIPKSAKLTSRPPVPQEPHYPSSFHASFDEGGETAGIEGPYFSNPSLGPGQTPHTVYENYHQQLRQMKRHGSSPLGSARQLPSPMGSSSRQLPMAPFGHRRTASSSSFGHIPPELISPGE